MYLHVDTLIEFVEKMTPESLCAWVNKLAPRTRFNLENCLWGMARDHDHRVSLLDSHISHAIKERSSLKQLGALIFCDWEPPAGSTHAIIRGNQELRNTFERLMAAPDYGEQAEAQSLVPLDPESGKLLFSIIMAKHQLFAEQHPPLVGFQRPSVIRLAPASPMEVVDLCSDDEDDKAEKADDDAEKADDDAEKADDGGDKVDDDGEKADDEMDDDDDDDVKAEKADDDADKADDDGDKVDDDGEKADDEMDVCDPEP